MRWTLLRRASAALIALSAAACAGTLPLAWHTVRSETVTSPELAAAALYIGPDYHVSGQDRAEMLQRAHTQTLSACDGLTHFHAGGWPMLVAVGVILLALLAVAWPPRRSAFAIGFVSAAATGSAVVLAAGPMFLRHLLEPVQDHRLAADIFLLGLGLCTLSTLVLLIAAAVELATLPERPVVGPDHLGSS